jgi:hypothetical protein
MHESVQEDLFAEHFVEQTGDLFVIEAVLVEAPHVADVHAVYVFHC